LILNSKQFKFPFFIKRKKKYNLLFLIWIALKRSGEIYTRNLVFMKEMSEKREKSHYFRKKCVDDKLESQTGMGIG
jgi:hypothetical protein